VAQAEEYLLYKLEALSSGAFLLFSSLLNKPLLFCSKQQQQNKTKERKKKNSERDQNREWE
jgi:hypothetical protein